jgi:hypothetical protein
MRNTEKSSACLVEPAEGHFYEAKQRRSLELRPLEKAAAELDMAPDVLLRWCEDVADRCGDMAVARLENGVTAFHDSTGRWLFRLPVRAADGDPA